MGLLTIKPGVQLDQMTIAGALIIAALFRTAVRLQLALIVTSGTDGEHSGPADPHLRGEAYDVRSQTFTGDQKALVLATVLDCLAEFTGALGGRAHVDATPSGMATDLFFGFLETAGQPREHFHFQLRRGMRMPAFVPVDHV